MTNIEELQTNGLQSVIVHLESDFHQVDQVERMNSP